MFDYLNDKLILANRKLANINKKLEHQIRHLNRVGLDVHPENPLEVQLTGTYHRFCRQAKVTYNNGAVKVRKNNRLDATIYYPSDNVYLTRYDTNYLSDSDIRALLAHETGHLLAKHYFENDYWEEILWLVWAICSGLLMFLLFMFKFRPHDAVSAVLSFIGLFALVLLTGLAVGNSDSEREEVDADKHGAELVGASAMVHLMRSSQEYEAERRDEIIRYIKLLWDCPVTELEMLMILIGYDALHFSRAIHITAHPTYQFRIRRLIHIARKRYSERK